MLQSSQVILLFIRNATERIHELSTGMYVPIFWLGYLRSQKFPCLGCWQPWSGRRENDCRKPTTICENSHFLERSYACVLKSICEVDSIFFSEGQQLRYCGIGRGYDDIFIKGNPSDMKVSIPPSFSRFRINTNISSSHTMEKKGGLLLWLG